MPIIEWDDKYLVGHKDIDAHHQHLVELLNKAYEHCIDGGTEEEFEKVIKEIAQYAAYHFECEERWRGGTSYPELDAHKEEHRIFASKLTDIRASRSGESSSAAFDLLLLLVNWFTQHILVTDHNYRHYLTDNAKGYSVYLMKRTLF